MNKVFYNAFLLEKRYFYLILSLLVIILTMLIVILFKKRKKVMVIEKPVQNIVPVHEDNEPVFESIEVANPIITEPQPEAVKLPHISIRLTKVGLIEEEVYHSEVQGELIIGRDPSKSNLPFQKDELISSRHCAISYKPKNLYIKDLSSTNGTYVNGVPIKGPYKLENDDIITIGSTELRINW